MLCGLSTACNSLGFGIVQIEGCCLKAFSCIMKAYASLWKKRPLYSTNWEQNQPLTSMFPFSQWLLGFWHISDSTQPRKRQNIFQASVLVFWIIVTWINPRFMPSTKNVATDRIYSVSTHLLSPATRHALLLLLYKCKKQPVVVLSPASHNKKHSAHLTKT